MHHLRLGDTLRLLQTDASASQRIPGSACQAMAMRAILLPMLALLLLHARISILSTAPLKAMFSGSACVPCSTDVVDCNSSFPGMHQTHCTFMLFLRDSTPRPSARGQASGSYRHSVSFVTAQPCPVLSRPQLHCTTGTGPCCAGWRCLHAFFRACHSSLRFSPRAAVLSLLRAFCPASFSSVCCIGNGVPLTCVPFLDEF